VTLGRARERERIAPERLQAAVQALPQRRRPAGFPVRQVVLFRSQLFASGPLYTALSEHPLAPNH
jgi:2'-5' RNA ligase